MIDNFVNTDMSMEVLFNLFIRDKNPYIQTVPIDFTELMDHFVTTVSTKLPDLLKIDYDEHQQQITSKIDDHGTELDPSP